MEGSVDRDAGAMIRDGIKCMEKLGVCPEAVWKSLGRWMAWDGIGWYGMVWMVWDGMGWYGWGWVAGRSGAPQSHVKLFLVDVALSFKNFKA